jgi:hypothetical protein
MGGSAHCFLLHHFPGFKILQQIDQEIAVMKSNNRFAVIALGISLLPSIAEALSIRTISLPVNDILYDSTTQRIYASVASSAGLGVGNTISTIDPFNGTRENSVFVGSEPGPMAMSSDGASLYVGLDGAGAVRRYHIDTGTAGAQFSLGADSFHGARFAEDMVGLAGHPDSVAVSLRYKGVSPRHAGVTIYDSGIARPVSTPGHTGSNRIEPSAQSNRLIGFNNETTEFGLRTLNVDAHGVTQETVVGSVVAGFGADIEYLDGRIYATGGQVVDASTLSLLGTFPFQAQGSHFSQGALEADSVYGLMYFVAGGSFDPLSLKVFDLATFVPITSMPLTGLSGTPRDLIRWGDDGLALLLGSDPFVGADQLVLLSGVPIPVPAAVWLLGSGILGLLGIALRRSEVVVR